MRKAFDPFNNPIKNYLRFADINRTDFFDLAHKLVDQIEFNNDAFARLSKSGSVDGHIGLQYVIGMYSRYLDWATPLLKVISDSVCVAEGKTVPEVGLGITRRVELIQRSPYSDLVDCVDPLIRHAASHNGISYVREQGIVRFCGLDSDGNRKFDDFELSYAQAADKTRDFMRGFVPGLIDGFAMHQVMQSIVTVLSGEYQQLLLLIDNEAAA